MNRRSFFKFLPVAPVVMIAEGARAATEDLAPSQPTISLQLNAQKTRSNQNGCFPFVENDPTRQVSMSVGEDGRLWIKSKDDVWKRVATE